MAWEPIPVAAMEDGLRIDLPFGFESFTLLRSGNRLKAGKKLQSGDALRLRLDQSEPPPFVGEEIRFSNGDVELAGTLVRPPGDSGRR